MTSGEILFSSRIGIMFLLRSPPNKFIIACKNNSSFGILLKMQSLNSIFKTFVTFAPLFLDLFAVLFIIFYFFAALGVFNY